MATLEKFRQFHYDATVKVSENTRTLALSAIAIIWLFKSGDSSHYVMPTDLAKPLALVLMAMALDFFQHVYRSVVWHIEFSRLEKKLHAKEIKEDEELYVSRWLTFPAYVFFYSKVLLLMLAYIGLLGHALRAISWK